MAGTTARALCGHTGETTGGHVRYVKVERIGRVTIYKRGRTYSLYYRECGETVRRPVDGNLTTARATASKVNAALEENRPSPLGFRKTSPQELYDRYLESVNDVQQLALRTRDRYRAALMRFVEYCEADDIGSIDVFDEPRIERFIAWLRRQTRVRNGARQGKREAYKLGGIKFILSTCRTAFNWASRQRLLPPYARNPFLTFKIDRLRAAEHDSGPMMFTAEQEKQFFDACNEWQTPVFRTLATYGLRVGELTHLLVEDVDPDQGAFHIRSKPELMWTVKSRRHRTLPLTPEMRLLFEQLIGERKAGFVFLHEEFVSGAESPPKSFASDKVFRAHIAAHTRQLREAAPETTDHEQLRAVRRFCRSMGQIPEKRVRDEFMRLTKAIGCPEFTRVHDLRHLFSSRAQELGMNPLLVQELLGHATLQMTERYTHLGLEAKRTAMARITTKSTNRSQGKP